MTEMRDNFDLSGAETRWKPTSIDAIGSYSQPIAAPRTDQPYRVAKWKGDPGVYDRPNGMPWSEIFVVYSGRGEVRFTNQTIQLVPGAVIDLRKGVPYVMEISETVEKMALIVE